MTDPTNNPLVSIIVRTKNRPELLESALRSIASQTCRPIEVVLVNDGGCDLEAGDLKGILGDVSLNYIRLEKNTGRANAGNIGIEHAKGAYVGFLDDDDEFYPEHLSVLVGYLEQSDLKVSYTDSMMVYKDYNPETHEIIERKKELVFSEDFDYGRLVFENYIPFMCALFDREVIKNSGGFDVSFELYEDWDLLLRIGEKFPFHHIKRTTADYNQWSAELQIAQNNADPDFLKHAYLRVLAKHFAKVTPQWAHDCMSRSLAERHLLRRLEREVRALGDQNSQIPVLEGEVKWRDVRIANLEAVIREREGLIEAMRNTRGWRVLDRYRRVRDKLLPPVVAKSLMVFKNQGSKALIQKANRRLLLHRSIKQTLKAVRMPDLPIAAIDRAFIDEPLDAKVSVIIPTRNAGKEFEYALRRITQQDGIGSVELIIIDSGSEGKTVEMSKLYAQKVLCIPPREFHHARTRNLGAAEATGDFLVFTVQDAIPVGNQWLYKLLRPIHEGRATAVSARQIPHSDSDLFACWSYWEHCLRYLGNDRDRFCDHSSFDNFDELDMQKKRSMAGLDNVCMGIAKRAFDAYRFNADYAEDFELGIRLIKSGHTLMFQYQNAVIHSHNRTPMYYLKRSYVDAVSLAYLLKIERSDMTADSILGEISCLYGALKRVLELAGGAKKFSNDPHSFVNSLGGDLEDALEAFDPSWQLIEGDPLLDEYFRNVPAGNSGEAASGIFPCVAGSLSSFSEYVASRASVHDGGEDFVNSLYKVFANAAGNYLGMSTGERIPPLFEGV